ncbi:MAG: outer membrane protein assembly factor [Alphaproteobacteria bacterium]|nr:MAG: outer membrane protein assembly factor [Alphaproteobacteria bacterium]
MPLTYAQAVLAAALLASFVPSLPASAAETAPATDKKATGQQEKSFAYDWEVKGAPNGDLEDLLEASSRLEQLEDKPPISLVALRRRAEEDQEGFKKVLRSEGYYEAKVSYHLDKEVSPIRITLNVEAGPQYTIGAFDIKFAKDKPPEKIPSLKELDITIGMAARSQPILDAEQKIITLLSNNGYPNARMTSQKAVVDFATRKMEVAVTVDPGPLLYMGALKFEGLKAVKASYLRDLAAWQAGRPWNAREVDELRRTFLRTGLFDNARVTTPKAAPAGQTVPVVITFSERPHRSVGAGVSYSTSEGAGTSAYWENRNLFGGAEKLRGDVTLAEIKRELKVSFTKPEFLAVGQNFNTNFDILHENTEAYKEDSVSTYAGIDRPWQENWTVSVGTSLEYSKIEDSGQTDNFFLAGIPFGVRYNSTDSLLDPTSGFRASSAAVPYIGLNQVSPDFLRLEFNGSTYYPVTRDKKFVLAVRGKIGMMAGEDSSDIPATKRFYAGGGGSVRGYKYQTVGPLDANNDPTGGRSLLEAGFEARWRITDSIGIVPFIEGGNVYDSMAPDFSGEFLWGAGLGFRYYTAIGPIRFDVAVPLNRRAGVDDAYQLYFSIGQAF